MSGYYTWFPQILNMSLTAGIVILCVLVVRAFLKRMPKIFSYMLWSVVLLRLLCPLSFGSAISLFQVMEAPVSEEGIITYVPENIVHTEFPAVDLPIEAANIIINQQLPQGEEQLVADPLEFPVGACTNLWIIGMCLMWICGIGQFGVLARKLIGAVKKEHNIYVSDYITTPFVLGIFCPRIYLPTGLKSEEQEYIIRHEQIHIRRLDHIFRLLVFLALSLHWFNPLVWLAFYLSGKDMEMSCDEAVMQKMGNEFCADYSTSLLKLATGRKVLPGMPLAFGEGNVKERIVNIVRYKKPAAIAVGGATVLVIGAIFVLAGNPVVEETQKDRSVKTEEATGIDVSTDTEYLSSSANSLEATTVYEYEIIDIITPTITADMPVGADGTVMDYADGKIIIFHDYFGLFVYDVEQQGMIGAVDLAAIGCQYTQGDNYCEVSVAADGTRVYLHPVSEENMYVYDVAECELIKQEVQQEYFSKGKEIFGKRKETKVCVEPDPTVFRSAECVAISDYWYLESGSGMAIDLCYVRLPYSEDERPEGTEQVRLFDSYNME